MDIRRAAAPHVSIATHHEPSLLPHEQVDVPVVSILLMVVLAHADTAGLSPAAGGWG